VEAALLARDGYTAPTTGIEGRRGLAALTAPGAELDAVTAGLGEKWRLEPPRIPTPVETPSSVRDLVRPPDTF